MNSQSNASRSRIRVGDGDICRIVDIDAGYKAGLAISKERAILHFGPHDRVRIGEEQAPVEIVLRRDRRNIALIAHASVTEGDLLSLEGEYQDPDTTRGSFVSFVDKYN